MAVVTALLLAASLATARLAWHGGPVIAVTRRLDIPVSTRRRSRAGPLHAALAQALDRAAIDIQPSVAAATWAGLGLALPAAAPCADSL